MARKKPKPSFAAIVERVMARGYLEGEPDNFLVAVQDFLNEYSAYLRATEAYATLSIQTMEETAQGLPSTVDEVDNPINE